MTKVLTDGNGSDIVQIVGKGLFVPLASREELQLKLDSIEAAHAIELEEANNKAKHWRSNHDAQVERARLLTERPDMPVERVQAYELVRTLIAERGAQAPIHPDAALENEFYNWAKAHGLIVDGHPPHATVMQRYDELVFAEVPELKEQLHLAQDAQQVYWHSPDTAPAVAEGSLCLCWIAVRQHCEGTEPQVRVFAANYINKPLFLDENGEPTAEDYHVTADGEPVGAVGWHNEHHHPEFSAYFEEITFSDSYQLLGWAEYKPPMWGAV